jgi:hypothetical protein
MKTVRLMDFPGCQKISQIASASQFDQFQGAPQPNLFT